MPNVENEINFLNYLHFYRKIFKILNTMTYIYVCIFDVGTYVHMYIPLFTRFKVLINN